MSKTEAIKLEGSVIDVMPNATFKVKNRNGSCNTRPHIRQNAPKSNKNLNG
jgi:translation initiation factor IF-1